MIPEKHRKKVAGAGAIALATGLVMSSEGFVNHVYKDPVGIPTYCFGETRNPQPGKTYSREECASLLSGRLEGFNAGIDRCIRVPLSDTRRAALLSFSYNVGTGALCSSGLARRINAGDPKACEELDKWVYATKAGIRIKLPGLVTRRAEERKLCQS